MLLTVRKEKLQHISETPQTRTILKQGSISFTLSCFSFSFSIRCSSHWSSTYCRNFWPFMRNSRPCSASQASIWAFNFFSSLKANTHDKELRLSEKLFSVQKDIRWTLCLTFGRLLCSSDLCFSSLSRFPPLLVNLEGSVAFFCE